MPNALTLYRSLEELPEDFYAGAMTIGNFDGVHRGHQRILSRVRELADQFEGPAVVFTFEPHPVRLLRPDEAPPPLTWLDRKAELLALQDIDVVVAYPTGWQLLSLSAEDYFLQIIRDQMRARALVEGPNFYFGKNRSGDVHLLKRLCEQHNLTLQIVEPLLDKTDTSDELVSSSRIRQAIADGDVDAANAMLTQPYRVRGMVTHGAGRGNTIGFPTANVSAVDTLMPGVGVYSGIAWVERQPWPAAINLGPNPTFAEDALKLEVHLVGFCGSLYGQPLEVDFLHRLRDIRPFDGVEALKSQLQLDVRRAQADFERHNRQFRP